MSSKYDTPQDQFVIAYLPYPDRCHTVLSHALPLAKMLDKGLILLYIEDKRYGGPTTDAAKPLLQAQCDLIRKEHPDTHYVAMRGSSREVLTALPLILYGVVVVAEVNTESSRHTPTHPKEVLHLLAESKIAYLTVQQPYDEQQQIKDVAFSVDYHRESKEKLIWASYFARFGRCTLHALSQEFNDEGLREMWQNNMRFMDKVFASLGITYMPHQFDAHGPFPETCALDYAATNHYQMIISSTTEYRDRDLIEWFIGTAEQRVVRNKYKMPVLFLNPRDDLYVLCN